VDWFTNTLEYRGWYWTWVAYKPHPTSWPATLHLVNMPVLTTPLSLCGHGYEWMELYMGGSPERIKPCPSEHQCALCVDAFTRLVYTDKIGHDAIPAEYRDL